MRLVARKLLWTAVCIGLAIFTGSASAQLAPLNAVQVPEPPDLGFYIRDKAAAIQLGKALFWDMQVGSDGVVACASCHFWGGADGRTRNQVNPGTEEGDTSFYKGSPNAVLGRSDFPYHKLVNPDYPEQGLARADNNDVTSSQGVVSTQFTDIVPGQWLENGTTLSDPVYNVAGKSIRQPTNVNAPTVINAIFNFANFLDGRANNVFNGANPFGPADITPKIVYNGTNGLTPILLRIRNASLASQATGPPLSSVEMSWAGRTWPKIGKKMLSLQPLARQIVHAQDSVLGPIANSTLTQQKRGLKLSYASLIQKAFMPIYWNNNTQIVTFDSNGAPTFSPRPAGELTTSQYTQMEANFSFFFGLAIQLYEATLISGDSKFDHVMEGSSAFTLQENAGFATFLANCAACHAGPELTNASVSTAIQPVLPNVLPNPRINPPSAIDFMPMLNGITFYDAGFYNISVRPTGADIHRGEDTPFPNPLVPGTFFPKSYSRLALLKRDGLLPPEVAAYSPDLLLGFRPEDTFPNPGRTAVFGAFKVPNLRNIELTGPYFHNGGMITLRQVVDFYARGADFRDLNIDNHAPAILPIGLLRGSNSRKTELVSFLLTLTDPRVMNEQAPFDHPELYVPNGTNSNAEDIFMRIKAVGNGGLPNEGLPPLTPFLNVNHFATQ